MWRRTRVRGYEGIYLIYVSVFTCVMWWVVFWVRRTKSWKEKCVSIRTISCLHCGLAEDLNFDLLFLLCFPVEDLRRGGVLAPVERPCLVAATDLSPWVYRGGTVSRFFFFVSPFSARGCSGRRKEGGITKGFVEVSSLRVCVLRWSFESVYTPMHCVSFFLSDCAESMLVMLS